MTLLSMTSGMIWSSATCSQVMDLYMDMSLSLSYPKPAKTKSCGGSIITLYCAEEQFFSPSSGSSSSVGLLELKP